MSSLQHCFHPQSAVETEGLLGSGCSVQGKKIDMKTKTAGDRGVEREAEPSRQKTMTKVHVVLTMASG